VKKLFLSLILLLLFIPDISASTIEVNTCTQANVQGAINTAISGDTVWLNCAGGTWSSHVNITKSLTIKGNGEDSTTITASSSQLFDIDLNDGDSLNMYDLGITGSTGGYAFTINGEWDALLIHDVKFTNITSRAFNIGYGDWVNINEKSPHGVFWNITYTNTNAVPFMWISAKDENWEDDDNFGTADAIYIEDSTFTWSSFAINAFVTDTEHGGRIVVRHNTITNSGIQTHDFGSTAQSRGNRILEAYGNTINCSGAECSSGVGIGLRGGTAVIYDNTIDSDFWAKGFFQIYRVDYNGWTGNKCDNTTDSICSSLMSHCDDASMSCYGSYQCSGNCVVSCSDDADCPGAETCITIDGHSDGYGWPCRDQTGRGKDAADNDTQASSPLYWWNNEDENTDTVVPIFNGSHTNYIQVERDYYLTAKGGYVAYTYPHPGRSGGGTPGDTTAPTIDWSWPEGDALACSTDPRTVPLQGEWNEAAVTHYCKDDSGDTCDGDTTFDDMLSAAVGGVTTTSGGIAFYQTVSHDCGTSGWTYWVRSQDAATNESLAVEISFSVNNPPFPQAPTGLSITECLGTVKNIGISGTTKTVDIN